MTTPTTIDQDAQRRRTVLWVVGLATEDEALNGFNAKITLREFAAGRLNTDWAPWVASTAPWHLRAPSAA